MKNNQKGFIVPLLIAIIAILLLGGGYYVYNQKKVISDLPLPIPVENSVANCDSYSLTTPAHYPDRSKGEIYKHSLVCHTKDGETTLIADLSQVEELKDLYRGGEALSLIASPKDSGKLIFGAGLPETDSGIGKLYIFDINNSSFIELKNIKINPQAVLSPNQDKIVSFSDKQISICDFINDKCSPPIVVLGKGEGLFDSGDTSSINGFNITWIDNNSLDYKVYLDNTNGPRKEKETRTLKGI